MQASFDGLVLHAEFESVEWVDDGLRNHSSDTTSNELRDIVDFLGVVVTFELCNYTLGSLKYVRGIERRQNASPTSYEPNLTADSGITLIMLIPLPETLSVVLSRCFHKTYQHTDYACRLQPIDPCKHSPAYSPPV